MRKSTKKLLVTAGISMILATGTAITSYAGEWNQTGYGWWYDNGNGSYTVNDWQYIDNTWYYFNQDGYMRTGWIPVNGKWYYCHANGAMAHDTWIDGKYYVGSDGALYTNTTTPDGFLVDGNGNCIEKDTETKKVVRKKTVTLTGDNWDRYLKVTDFGVHLTGEGIVRSGSMTPLLRITMTVKPTEEGKKYTFGKGSCISFEMTKGDWIHDYLYIDLNENGSGSYDNELEAFCSFTTGTGLSDLINKSFARSGSAKYEITQGNFGTLTPRE